MKTTIQCYENEDKTTRIYVATSDERLSIGSLVLKPQSSLPKHNRPVTEQLRQVYGTSLIKLFDNDIQVDEITLLEGDELVIPAKQYHIHSNPFRMDSVTIWKFKGNITKVILNIKTTFTEL